MAHDRCAALAALHLAFDGPLPRALRDAAANGGAERLDRLNRCAESRAIDRMAGLYRAEIATAGRDDAGATLERELRGLRGRSLALREDAGM